ncbi:hypothetical protein K504DRAFT_532369 [Pleomassaria siparia CBS 279.74]|uniref:histone deacetylase n=1 Tax=Pleomassaria siparia CBS 279.74 TaxID=1314801 RepID=A0A6G1KG17_9PLEO|nr:hypothetical protein K504DRAFT_532369 [Pleomassaria siparia CBS 279.74]
MANYNSDVDMDASWTNELSDAHSTYYDEDQDQDQDQDEDEDQDKDQDQDGSGDEFVDPDVTRSFQKDYERAQKPVGKTESFHDRSNFGHINLARAAHAKTTVDYKEKEIDDIPFAKPGPNKHHKQSAKWVRPKPNAATKLLWKQRRIEETFPYSFARPFRPSPDDIQRWKYEQCPAGWTAIEYIQPLPNDPLTMFNRHNSVEEYMASDDFVPDYTAFKGLSDVEKKSVIQREAEDNGLERPKGYTVSFHYNPHVEYHHFGSSHPMKPWRLTLTKQLIVAYGLEYTMDLYEPRPASLQELSIFHDRDYLAFLSQVTPQNMKPDDNSYLSFGFGGDSNDCPVFDGLWNYVSLYSGASMHAAQNLLNNQSDIAINWSGGLHHAKKNLASGFCYVNDIVLAIQLLLTQHQRVLYIDIDVHHGDGVEQAFESTDRVFTLSYHKYGFDRSGFPFFPGTGGIHETGPTDPLNFGKGHSLNIPIEDGIDDDQYKWLFKTVTGAVVDKYRPTAIVLQSGADSLGGDRLGRFNLNIKAHGFCIETVKNYGRPLVLIGGGGYTPRNVARTWCHETAVCVGANLHDDLPPHIPYIQAFQGEENGGGILYPDLHNTKRHDNVNSAQKLQNIVAQALENLRFIEGAPSVVVNTKGLTEEQLMRIREEVQQELDEEEMDRHSLSVESARRGKEKNVGGRGERR